jgi:hypothetical protein
MTRLANVAAALAAVLMLLAPALWNGFPLLEYDTGGYIARWFEGTLEVSRSTVYGLFLNALARPDFWPAVVVQAALTVWVIALILRAHGLGRRPAILLGTIAALSVATTLPWIAGILLTDIFAGLGVLALYLVVLRAETLAPWERVALIVLAGFAGASHSATLAVEIALVVCAAVAALFRRWIVPLAGLAHGIAAVVLAPLMLLAANYAVAGQIAWTPGGIGLSFGRMMQDGFVARFLADHCPDPRFKLCDYRAELPTDADQFFWGKSVFNQLGRFQGLNDEMRTIVLESVADYPLWQLEAATRASIRQLLAVRTGEGTHNEIWHTYSIMKRFTPSAAAAMQAARQQKGELDFTAINLLHVPVAYLSMALLLVIIALAIGGVAPENLGLLATTAALALLANAGVCGVLANPHDRYGARIAWIATLVVIVGLWRWGAARLENGQPSR